MKKQMMAAVLALAVAAGVCCGCGVSTTSTTTTTTTTVNEDGSSSTVTTTTTNDNGQVSESTTVETTLAEAEVRFIEEIPMKIANHTGVDFYGLYISGSDKEEWGNNIIDYTAEGVLYNDESLTGLTMSYYTNEPYYDFKVEAQDGSYLEFSEVDLTGCEEDFVVTFYQDEDGTYRAHVSLESEGYEEALEEEMFEPEFDETFETDET